MSSNYSLKYNVDIVMCIDVTGSMKGILNTVKQNALNFQEDLKALMVKKGKKIDKLRIKVIAFRDYLADGDNAMATTRFYNMPEDKEKFKDVIWSLKPDGGGDDPEDGLEALAYAIKSDWTKDGDKRRHVIVVWTDTSTHELGFGKNYPRYPKGMAKDFNELTTWWDQMNRESKRLLIYAPDAEYWNTISDCWDNTVHVFTEIDNGLEEYEYSEILNLIANTI
ncbi:MAG: VWA domain-containing protein [Oscillospiraceae bacterium]|nr:VWA domain-containing protein [Oscillospiraceae bacterium]